jgi:hypothetical protein
MQVALSLQYFPANGDSPVVTVCTTTNPAIIRQYRRALMKELERRTHLSAADPVTQQIARRDAERTAELLDFLLPAAGR